MKGFVSTPQDTVDTMLALLFQGRAPAAVHSVLDPGCGTGQFIDGIVRWCSLRGLDLPQITGVELDPRHIPTLEAKYSHLEAVHIHHGDFLAEPTRKYDFIVGNPPYVPITALTEQEKTFYRSAFSTARGRFDLYLLFFERAIQSLSPGGRLVFITPEKYLYVESAAPLRELLARHHVEEVRLFPEDTFGALVTYPMITVVNNAPPRETRVFRRNGSIALVRHLPPRTSWLPLIEGDASEPEGPTLGQICKRISCGVATGADSVFVRPRDGLDLGLRQFAYPTVAGRELTPNTVDIPRRNIMLIPYDMQGRLLPFERLGTFGAYLDRSDIRDRLLARSCARRKPWYAFHETPALREILRPKILCKDITETPHFWIDRSGDTVPRHSAYYIIPHDADQIEAIASYLNSAVARQWLGKNCQRAANGFLRLQSRILERLPIPRELAYPVLPVEPLAAAPVPPLPSIPVLTPRPPDAHTI